MDYKENKDYTAGYGLPAEDYLEPRCALCGEPGLPGEKISPVPQQRIVLKLNEYMDRRDYPGAERHLLYWLEEAKLGKDKRGELMIRNELIGHYRKNGEKEKSLAQADAALKLLEELDFYGTLSSGTTYVNAATACNAFGENDRALELFGKAREVYEANAGTAPGLLGGLYNNMGLALAALGRPGEAIALYEKALPVMEKAENGEPEQAITYLNMADAVELRDGPEAAEKEISNLLDRAYALLTAPGHPETGYYAFVCEKCAPAFSHYGYFLAAKKLSKKAEDIYARIAAEEE